MSLFKTGTFTSAAGLELQWKIECNALTDEDLTTIACVAGPRLNFSSVEGVPNGGLRLAQALEPFVTEGARGGDLLIVDDVFTTGWSMEQHRGGRCAQGLVLFARDITFPRHSWIKSIWTLSRWMR